MVVLISLYWPVRQNKISPFIKALELNRDKIYALKIDWNKVYDVYAVAELINHAKDLGINFVVICNGLEIITETIEEESHE